MGIVDIVGVSGFVLAVVTFGLTRWERREKVEFEFFTDWDNRFDHGIDSQLEAPVMVARIINTGQKQVILNRDSFVFFGGDKPVQQYMVDFFGKESLPSPLSPGCSAEVGIFLESFASQIQAGPKDQVEIGLEVKSLSGKRFKSTKKFVLLLEVHEIERRN